MVVSQNKQMENFKPKTYPAGISTLCGFQNTDDEQNRFLSFIFDFALRDDDD